MRHIQFVGKALDSDRYHKHYFHSELSETEVERLFAAWLTQNKIDITMAFWSVGIETAPLS